MNGEENETVRQELLIKFRERLSDVLKPDHDDHYLLRWLRARKFDLQKSEDMLRANLLWRAQVGADTILDDWEVPEAILRHYPGGFTGHDKDGRPVWIECVARLDMQGLLKSVKLSDLFKYKIYQAEMTLKEFKDQSAKLKKNVDNMVLILDLEGFGMKQLWRPAVSFGQEVLTLFEANYPETLYQTYVINAPAMFPIAYNLIKPFLSEDTSRKTQVLGANWKEQLLRDIDADQLPVHWGGTATGPDGDEYCRSRIFLGGDVDKKYYVKDLVGSIDRTAFTQVTVPRHDSLDLPFNVTESGSILRWRFLTEAHDIGFAVTQSASNGPDGDRVLVPNRRHNCHLIPEEGSIVCTNPGTYIATFDNSFSWVTPKKLFYQLDVLPMTNGGVAK